MMNRNYTSQVNDYLQGGQGSAPRQNGAFANMVPRQTMIRDQPHMLAYINPTEEQMLRDMGGSGLPGPDGIPAYDHWWGHSAAQYVGNKISSGVDYVTDAVDFLTTDDDLFANIGGDAIVNNTTNDDTTAGTTAVLPTTAATADTGADTGATTDTSLMTPAQVTAYENFQRGDYGSGIDANWAKYEDDGGIRLDLAANRYDATIAANNLSTGTDTTTIETSPIDTEDTTGALTNVGTDTTTIAANQDDGAASTKGFYELATGTKFEDTLVGGAIGVTPDSILGSEGAADAAFTSGADLIDGGGKDASGNTFEGNGALSNIIAGTANTLGVSTFNEDAGLASGEGSVYDVFTDVFSPTKIITNVLTGGEGVAGTIGNALEGTATGEFLANNIPYIANQLRIDNDSASVDNVLNELAGSLTGQDAINATVGYVVNEAIDNAVASNKGSSYDGNVDLNGDGIGTIYTDTNNNQQFDEGENTFASDDIFTDYPMIDYNEDLVGTEIIDPIITTSGPTREDRTTDETMDYTRRYIKDFSSHLPEYLRRFTVGEPIDGMFNEFVGEDGKTYYRTAEGEIYDAENFVNAAVGETASVGTGEKIVVGYTETDADGNSIDYDNEGNQVDGSGGGFDFGAPANLGDTYYDPELDTTYTYQEKPDGQGGFYSGWDITEGSGRRISLDPRERPGGFEGDFDFVTADMVPQYDQEGNAIVNADGSPVFGTSTGNGTPNGTGSTVVVGSR